MKSTDTTSILNRIGELKTKFSDRKLSAEEYTDPDTGFLCVRIVDGYNSVEVVEPVYTIDADGIAVEQFSPFSIIAEIEAILN